MAVQSAERRIPGAADAAPGPAWSKDEATGSWQCRQLTCLARAASASSPASVHRSRESTCRRCSWQSRAARASSLQGEAGRQWEQQA